MKLLPMWIVQVLKTELKVRFSVKVASQCATGRAPETVIR